MTEKGDFGPILARRASDVEQQTLWPTFGVAADFPALKEHDFQHGAPLPSLPILLAINTYVFLTFACPHPFFTHS